MTAYKRYFSSITAVTLILFTGCGSNESSGVTTSEIIKASNSVKVNALEVKESASTNVSTKDKIRVYSPQEIAMKSHCDYNDNSYGVITAKTLKKWISNWKKNRPKGVDGRLVILQAGVVPFGKEAAFLPHNDKDVLVYAIPAGGACDPSYKRFDGMSETPGAMVSGERIDRNINMFQIDPKKDFIVFAVANGSTAIREITRTWWSLVYWGWDLKRLGFLNGSVAYNFVNDKEFLVANPSPMPKPTHEYHMRDLKTDRTALHIYIDEMKKIASMDNRKGFFIADARGTAEYSGEKKSKSASKVCGVNHDQQCYTSFRGHIRGAVDFPYTDLLVMDDAKCDLNGDGKIDKHDASFKFKSYYDMKMIFKEKGYNGCDTILAYCRTGRKATVLALSALTILGYPVRMYDGSWMQWGMMSEGADTNGDQILPSSSALRTDIDKYSVVIGYNNQIDVEPRSTYNFNLDATSSRKIVEEDRAYLRGK